MPNSHAIVVGLFGMLAGSGAFAAACDGFTDVDGGNTVYCAAVTYIKDKGITLGCTGTTYCPNDYVTRLQMALFLQRVGQSDPSNVLGDYTNAIAGGLQNTANGGASTVAGGAMNSATGIEASVGGGGANAASGGWSTIPGGVNNTAAGNVSFAAGYYAHANDDGCFVWSDESIAHTVSCEGPNTFVVRSVGGIYMFTGGTQQDQYTGVVLPAGGSAWVVGSDRNGKEAFAAIDADDVLRKVVALPISTWKWKNQDASIRHMGPMAQDFSAAFGLGETPKGISTVDADGVALAAIQALHARVAELTERLKALEAILAAR